MTFGLRQRTDNVQMESLEAVIRHIQRSQRGLDVPGNLGPLTRDTGAAERLGVLCHVGPNETAAQIPESGIAARVGNVVDAGDDAVHHGGRNDRARKCRLQGNIAE